MGKKFIISVLKENFAICRLSAFEPLPAWVLKDPLSSITKTPEEYSVLCSHDAIPAEEQITCESEWKCLKIHGPLDFGEVGIISNLTSLLAKSDISVFVQSTYETDYILVKKMNIDKAAKVLSQEGHQIYFD
jgi:hypothetical protein